MKKVHLLLFAVILVLAGCSSNSENPITHLPFQTEKDGRWGLIDMEGNILLEDEFKHRPSVVIDGMFCVKNSDDMYEIYTAEKKPRQIGEEYLSVGPFTNGLAPVVKKDSRITYINKEGEVVIELTKYNDDPVVKAWSFENGIAIIATASGKGGCINTKGEFVIPPIYKEIMYAGENILLIRNDKDKVGYINYKGKTLVEPKYSYGYSFDKKGYALVELDEKHILIDKTGKELFKLKDDMKIIGDCSEENLIPYCLDDKSYGYLNPKGEQAIKLSSNIKNPTSFINGYAVFKNTDGDYGTIDTKGEVVIRAKYDNLNLIDGFDFLLFEDDNEWGLLSYSGDVIKRASYKYILPFQKGNKYTYAKDGDEWILIDQKGEDTKIVDVETIASDDHGYNYGVESDYLDIDAEVKKIININDDGSIEKLSYNTMPSQFEDMYSNSRIRSNTEICSVVYETDVFRYHFRIDYFEKVRNPIYEKQWISSRWGGYYEDVITGYSYNNNNRVRGFVYCIFPINKLKNKIKETKAAIEKRLISLSFNKIQEDKSYIRWKKITKEEIIIINMNLHNDEEFLLTIYPEKNGN